ncbi:MAG: TRAP transporter large permease [Rhodocyclaceae bacterium]|nr:MAG: TRAP transporter large permease [Rhodocyclaceae bacterium]
MMMALIGFAALIAISLTGIPLAYGTLLIGFVGFAVVRGWEPALAMTGQQVTDMISNSNFVVVPIFILMGEFIRRGGIADELYEAANALLGRLRGGLAMSTILACGAFAAVCGSSVACAATMTKVALPPMRRFGYHDKLAAGTVAAGGTLGILIPPSIPMVIYCVFAREDIGRMFMAGVVPGLLMMLIFVATIAIWVRMDKDIVAPGIMPSRSARFAAIRKTWAFIALFLLVLGSLYLGVATPNEAASIGAVGAYLFALARGKMRRWSEYRELFGGAIATTAAILAIASCGLVFSQFINIVGLPYALQQLVASWELHGTALVLPILGLCIILGFVFEALAILILIVPIFLPSLQAGGVDLIWFGILMIIKTEFGLITPPFGINVFTVRSAQPDVALGDIFRGIVPFIVAMLVTAALILVFPEIATALPNMMR